jgi:hypothetical protein
MSNAHSRGSAIPLPDFLQNILAFLFFIIVSALIIKKFTFPKFLWGFGFFILCYGILSGSSKATIFGAIASSVGFLMTVLKNEFKTNTKKNIILQNNPNKEIIENTSPKDILNSLENKVSANQVPHEVQDVNASVTKSTDNNESKKIKEIEYFNDLDRKIAECSFEWILEKDGLVNLHSKKFIPKSQLREVDIDGVNGCLILNSFLYGVNFIPSNKIKGIYQ